jgi:hypothetical protein
MTREKSGLRVTDNVLGGIMFLCIFIISLPSGAEPGHSPGRNEYLLNLPALPASFLTANANNAIVDCKSFVDGTNFICTCDVNGKKIECKDFTCKCKASGQDIKTVYRRDKTVCASEELIKLCQW